jgi:hypothetical protein
MDTRKRGSTSEMQVTSIRLEPELKERLREISGEQGYQTLIRDVPWRFVERQVRPDDLLHDGSWQLPPPRKPSPHCPPTPRCFPYQIFERHLGLLPSKNSDVSLQVN